MSALTKLAEFVHKLPDNLHPEFMQLVDAVTDERDRLQNERLATLQATTGTFDVVAIAGTAEQLLNDVTDTELYISERERRNTATNIKKGDWVELIPNEENKEHYGGRIAQGVEFGKAYKVRQVFKKCIRLHNDYYWHYSYMAYRFRKVSTPSINPLNSVEGC